jgi:hypothetical protein
VGAVVHVEEDQIDIGYRLRDNGAHVPADQRDARIVQSVLGDESERAAHQSNDCIDLFDDDDARFRASYFEHSTQRGPEAKAAYYDASRRTPTQSCGQSAKSKLGPERRAREKDDCARDELYEVARLAQDEVPGPVDGAYSYLATLRGRHWFVGRHT